MLLPFPFFLSGDLTSDVRFSIINILHLAQLVVKLLHLYVSADGELVQDLFF
jgi:hypothetical protein